MLEFNHIEKEIINRLNHPICTVEFLEKMVSLNESTGSDPTDLMVAQAKGYYQAVKQIAKAMGADIESDLDKVRNAFINGVIDADEFKRRLTEIYFPAVCVNDRN